MANKSKPKKTEIQYFFQRKELLFHSNHMSILSAIATVFSNALFLAQIETFRIANGIWLNALFFACGKRAEQYWEALLWNSKCLLSNIQVKTTKFWKIPSTQRFRFSENVVNAVWTSTNSNCYHEILILCNFCFIIGCVAHSIFLRIHFIIFTIHIHCIFNV